MKNKIGVWIDHRKAVIVSVTEEGEKVQKITSLVEKHVRFAGGAAELGQGEDVHDRQFGNQLNGYYDDVIACFGEAESIFIFGPGEAKIELEARLEHAGMKESVVEIETVDKMTDPQIAAKVRLRFMKH